jgi:hypothetical protein
MNVKRLLAAASACLLFACDSPTDPDELAELVDPIAYEGQARFLRVTTVGSFMDNVSIVGPVRFVASRGDRIPITYTLQAGTMAVAHVGNYSGRCTLNGTASVDLGPGDGTLTLREGGRYSGEIHKEVRFSSSISCPGAGGAVLAEDVASIDLIIEGFLADGHMRGEMPPQRETDSVFEGSWDFRPILP